MPPRCFFIALGWTESPLDLHFRALGRTLAERGHRVVFLVYGNLLAVDDPDANPAIFRWPSPRPTTLSDAQFLSRHLRRYQPQCLIANFSAVNVMLLMGRLRRVPVRVAWYHTLSEQISLDSKTSPWHTAFQRFRKRLVYRCATHLVANSGATRDDLCAMYGVPREKCTVWHYTLADPLTTGALTTTDIDIHRPRDRRIVCVGRLDPSKGHETLLRAIQQLPPSAADATVEFIGDGIHRPTLEQLARDLGVSDRCRFVGRLPHNAVLQRMARAMVSVTPSLSEAFGLVNIESFAVGTPVIASAVGGIPELFHNEQEGFLVPPGNAESLAEKLTQFLTDSTLSATKGAAARATFLNRFEQARFIHAQADWYERLVS